MRHVLIIAYDFPPSTESGVYRPVKFIKYLHDLGWRCTVVTVALDHAVSLDGGLAVQLPGSTKVVRARPLDPYTLYRRLGGRRERGSASLGVVSNGGTRGGKLVWLAQRLLDKVLVPDGKIGWYLSATREIQRLMARDAPELVMSTSPRETAHLIGRRTSRRYGIPWLADFRDPWVGAFFAPRKIFPFSALNRFLERRVVESATACVFTTAGTRAHYAARYPDLSQEKFHVITNGFDDVAEDAGDVVRDVCAGDSKTIGFLHTGRFYPEHRSPDRFLEALSGLCRNAPELGDRLHVRFVGTVQEFVRERVSELGLEETVELTGHLPYRDAAREMRAAHVLLFLDSTFRPSEPDYLPGPAYLPGKLFEYIGAMRPILALAEPQSDSARILAGLPWVVVADPRDTAAISEGIRRMLDLLSDSGALPVIDPHDRERFHCRRSAQELARLFAQLAIGRTT